MRRKQGSGPSAARRSAGTAATRTIARPARQTQNPPQPPIPHWGNPQPPDGAGLQVGKSREPAVCAAGTLSSFSSFELLHSGQ